MGDLMKVRKKNFILLMGFAFFLLASMAYSVKILGFDELRFDGALLINSTTLSIKTNDIVRLFVNSDGNVGIGTTSPGKKLEVSDATDSLTFDPSATIPTINTSSPGGNAKNITIASEDGSIIIQLG